MGEVSDDILSALSAWSYKVVFHGNGHNEGDPASKTMTGDEFRAALSVYQRKVILLDEILKRAPPEALV